MNEIDWRERLSMRQINILRRLRDEGALTQTQLKVRGSRREWAETLQDLYLLDLADGWFTDTREGPDGRYWEITNVGRECLEAIESAKKA